MHTVSNNGNYFRLKESDGLLHTPTRSIITEKEINFRSTSFIFNTKCPADKDMLIIILGDVVTGFIVGFATKDVKN